MVNCISGKLINEVLAAMKRREIIKLFLDGKKPPCVSCSFKFTKDPYELLRKNFGTKDLLFIKSFFV